MTYLTIPFVVIFGLEVASIRFPVALAAVASVWLVYDSVRLMTGRREWGLVAMLVTSCAGWHFFFARWGIPTMLAASCLIWLWWSLLQFIQRPAGSRWQIVMAIAAAVCLTLSYAPHRLLGPVLVGLSAAGISAWLPAQRRAVSWLLLGYVLLSGPYLWLNYTQQAEFNQRFWQMSVLDQPQALPTFVRHYTDYFSLPFLFPPDGQMSDAQMTGAMVFVPISAIGLLFGLGAIVHHYRHRGGTAGQRRAALSYLLLLSWILAAPVPAALTIDRLHLIRALHLLPLVLILYTLGLRFFSHWLQGWLPRPAVVLCIGLLVGAQVLPFADYYQRYFGRYVYSWPGYFQPGLRETMQILVAVPECQRWTVDSRLNQPYIYYLFATRRSPDTALYSALDQWSHQATDTLVLDHFTFRPTYAFERQGSRPVQVDGLAGQPYSVYSADDQHCLLLPNTRL